MKQRINIFIMIGLIVLACGQLQGSQEMSDEDEENISSEVKSRLKDIENFAKNIRTERKKDYKEANFYNLFLEGEELERSFLKDYVLGEEKLERSPLKDYVVNLLTEDEYLDLLQEFKKAERFLVAGVLNNATKGADSIIQYVEDIKQYIERLSSNDHSLSSGIKETMGMIMDIIDKKINPLLDSMLQSGLFVDELLKTRAYKEIWKRAKNKALEVIYQVKYFLHVLVQYIEILNAISTIEEGGNLLERAHFDATVLALQVMDNIINSLYVKLSKIFIKDVLLRDELDEFIVKQRERLINLKVALYDIYATIIDRAQMRWSDIEKFKQKLGEELGKSYGGHRVVDFNKVTQIFDELAEYVTVLNETSKKEKDGAEPRLKIDDFFVTVSALQVMQSSIKDFSPRQKNLILLYEVTPEPLTDIYREKKEILSNLKNNLYDIYEVRQKADNKIAIKYYYASLLPWKTDFYYSKFLDDPLVEIGTHVSAIKKFTEGLRGLAQSFETKEFGKEAAAILTEAILGQVGGSAEGIAGVAAAVTMIQQKIMERKRTTELEGKKKKEKEERHRIDKIGNLGFSLASKVGLSQMRIVGGEYTSLWREKIKKEAYNAKQAVEKAVMREGVGKLGAINRALAAIPGEVKKAIPGVALKMGMVIPIVDERELSFPISDEWEAAEAVKMGKRLALEEIKEMVVNNNPELESKVVMSAQMAVLKAVKREEEGEEGAIDKALAAVQKEARKKIKEVRGW